MKESWLNDIKRKLEGHRKSPPEGLWEGISQQMGLENVPARKQPLVSRKRWMAAASVLALLGFFAFYFHDKNGPQTTMTEKPQLSEESVMAVEPPVSTVLAEKEQTAEPSASTPSHVGKGKYVPLRLVATEDTVLLVKETPQDAQEEETLVADTHSESPRGDSGVEQQEPPVQENDSLAETVIPRSDLLAGNLPVPERSSSVRSNRWSFGVNASSELLATQNQEATDRVYYDSSKQGYSSTYNGEDHDIYAMRENVMSHHVPVRLGVSLQYQLNRSLFLQSGVSYCYLYSEFSIPVYEHARYDQKLHYIGIPLGVAWNCWSSGHLRAYLSSGVMVEKCLNERPWQWSVNASAGAEYTLTRQVGVYLEPSFGYYFDDGTVFEHYYKENPFAPSINFGLRWHIKN